MAEHRFVDAVTRNLRGGRVLLVIAGDGIREDVVALTELIGRNSTLGFSFGLVELAIYDFAPEGILVQPRVPMRSHVVERKVMVLPGGDTLDDVDPYGADLDVDDPQADPTAATGKHAAYRQWWEPVLAMRFDDPDQPPPGLYWPNHVRIQMPWPRIWITAFRNDAQGGVAGVFLASQKSERDRLMTLLEPLDDLLTLLPEGTFIGNGGISGKRSIFVEKPNKCFGSADESRHWLMGTMNDFVNVLRPRLKRLATEVSV